MARSTKRKRRLWDAYAFPGFRPLPTVRGVFGDPKARVITLRRRSKKRVVGRGVEYPGVGTTDASDGSGTLRAATCAFTWHRSYATVEDCKNKGIESYMGGKNLCLSHFGYTSWLCYILPGFRPVRLSLKYSQKLLTTA